MPAIKTTCAAIVALCCLAGGAMARDCDGLALSDTSRKAFGAVLAPSGGQSMQQSILRSDSSLRPPPPKCARDDALLDLLVSVRRTLIAGGVVVLGEVHDNPRHHVLRAEILRAVLSAQESRPALVFEHLRADQSAIIDRINAEIAAAAVKPTAASVLDDVAWSKSGWPDGEQFAPLFEAAIRFRLPLAAGDPPRGRVRDVARRGDAVLAGDAVWDTVANVAFPDQLEAALLDELAASHCGLMPKSAFGNMALAQRYRDAHLADAVDRARRKHGAAVLLTGNGHARSDRGVPHYLASRLPVPYILSVLIVEREESAASIASLAPKTPQGAIAGDFLIATERQDRPDPCEEMRKAMEKKMEKSREKK